MRYLIEVKDDEKVKVNLRSYPKTRIYEDHLSNSENVDIPWRIRDFHED